MVHSDWSVLHRVLGTIYRVLIWKSCTRMIFSTRHHAHDLRVIIVIVWQAVKHYIENVPFYHRSNASHNNLTFLTCLYVSSHRMPTYALYCIGAIACADSVSSPQLSSWPNFPYRPLLALPLLSLRDRDTILPIHPPIPSPLPLRPLLLSTALPLDPLAISGGSMSSPGIASPAEKAPGPRGVPLRMSIDDGDPTPISESCSACVAGVGIAVVASPNNAFMSSNRTLAVSGYKKYTVEQLVTSESRGEQTHQAQS